MFGFVDAIYGYFYPKIPSVESSLEKYGVDLDEAKESVSTVLREKGKVEAIKHLNSLIAPRPPMHLRATLDFVNKLENQIT
ncbi:hypothetical protein [Pseudoalteromonas sp. TAB23]|uniref:hypothetical protein n=1 Tax=Pseudoalteromonas sp. TAB23 TaxID=1938595 RepID=UPI0004670876|nr:hypothetical protein [Pseudoalteromonas sp. TAB23]